LVLLQFAEVYLEIGTGGEQPPFSVLLKNLPILLKIMVTASSRIRALVAPTPQHPQYQPNGFYTGKSENASWPAFLNFH
jgi:hypothetical protein